jgi:hypothetical protein
VTSCGCSTSGAAPKRVHSASGSIGLGEESLAECADLAAQRDSARDHATTMLGENFGEAGHVSSRLASNEHDPIRVSSLPQKLRRAAAFTPNLTPCSGGHGVGARRRAAGACARRQARSDKPPAQVCSARVELFRPRHPVEVRGGREGRVGRPFRWCDRDEHVRSGRVATGRHAAGADRTAADVDCRLHPAVTSFIRAAHHDDGPRERGHVLRRDPPCVGGASW